MVKKFVIAAVVCAAFSPFLFSDMFPGNGMGTTGMGTGMGGQQPGGGRHVNVSKQPKDQSNEIRVSTDSVVDILLFQDRDQLNRPAGYFDKHDRGGRAAGRSG